MIALKTKHLRLKIDDLTIFHDLNVEIYRGEFIGLVGPLGCGKTTLLKLLGALRPPSSGQVEFFDQKLKKPSTQIAYVWQKANLMPWRTVAQNVSLPLEIRDIHPQDINIRVKEALRLVGLDKWSHFYPKQLSGGMEQLTALARAIVADSRILLLDEPFAALDILTRQKMNQEILRLWKTKRLTIVLVTHNIAEAIYMSDRIFIMGQIPRGVVKTLINPQARKQNPALKQSPKYLTFYGKILNTMG